MDDADRAQSMDDLVLKDAMARVPPLRGRNAGRHCLSCGEEIPQGRRDAVRGCELCFECQEALERGMGR